MKTLFATALVLLACTLSTGSFAHPGDTDPGGPTDPVPMPPVILKGLVTDHSGFTIQVESNGCTNKESFELLVLESYPAQVHITRIKEDWCRGYLPYGTKLTYSYAELGLSMPQSFTIINEINTGLLPKR